MVKIKVRAKKEAVEQARDGDFGDPPQPGLYHLELKGIEKKQTQGSKDKFYLNCRWQPVGVGREGTKPEKKLGSVWDSVSLTSEDSEWVRARLALALGAKPNRAGNVELDIELDSTKPGSPVGTVVLGRVKGGKDLEDNYKPQIGWIGPLDAAAVEEGDAFNDDDGDEEEAEEPFGDDDEDTGDEEYLTEEYLTELGNKELAELLPEFDLSKAALTVKVKGKVNVEKTRAKMIAAILEAQGADEPDGEGEDEEDDPF